jgi:hypothetical protein
MSYSWRDLCQNVEPVLRDKDEGSKLGLVLSVGRGSQVGSHRRSAWGHIGPTKSFDSGRSSGIRPRPATSADIRDLVRIEGVKLDPPRPADYESGFTFPSRLQPSIHAGQTLTRTAADSLNTHGLQPKLPDSACPGNCRRDHPHRAGDSPCPVRAGSPTESVNLGEAWGCQAITSAYAEWYGYDPDAAAGT